MSEYYGVTRVSDAHLEHHGIKGQKWGVRRFQNADGSLTSDGMKRYGVDASGNMSKEGARLYREDTGKNYVSPKAKANKDKIKKALVIGASIAGAALAAYGVYKLHSLMKQNNGPAKSMKSMPQRLLEVKKVSDNIGNSKKMSSMTDLVSYTKQNSKTSSSLLSKWSELAKNNRASVDKASNAVDDFTKSLLNKTGASKLNDVMASSGKTKLKDIFKKFRKPK